MRSVGRRAKRQQTTRVCGIAVMIPKYLPHLARAITGSVRGGATMAKAECKTKADVCRPSAAATAAVGRPRDYSHREMRRIHGNNWWALMSHRYIKLQQAMRQAQCSYRCCGVEPAFAKPELTLRFKDHGSRKSTRRYPA